VHAGPALLTGPVPGRQVELLRDIEARLAAAPHWPPPPPAECSLSERARAPEPEQGDVLAGGGRWGPGPAWPDMWGSGRGYDSEYGDLKAYGDDSDWDDVF
jgi:hypothetical protein